jgi:hypothetical protein
MSSQLKISLSLKYKGGNILMSLGPRYNQALYHHYCKVGRYTENKCNNTELHNE